MRGVYATLSERERGTRRRSEADRASSFRRAWSGTIDLMERSDAQPSTVFGLGDPIGLGRTAEVFASGGDEVIKLLRPGFSDRLGEHEATVAALVAKAAVAAPRWRRHSGLPAPGPAPSHRARQAALQQRLPAPLPASSTSGPPRGRRMAPPDQSAVDAVHADFAACRAIPQK
jgi:hypothetical protein